MSQNIVFMTAVTVPGKESRAKPYKFGIDSFKFWCDKHGHKLVVLNEPLYDASVMKPNFFRYFCFDLLDQSGIEYDQVLLTDADAIIHPECPDFFKLTNNKFTVTRCEGSYDWIIRSMENYGRSMFGGKVFDISHYFNAGFLVVNESHKSFLKIFTDFYIKYQSEIRELQEKYKTGTDQPLINHLVNSVYNIPIEILPYTYCMADLSRKDLLTDDLIFTNIKGIYQFNAIPNNVEDELTYRWMKDTFEKLYN